MQFDILVLFIFPFVKVLEDFVLLILFLKSVGAGLALLRFVVEHVQPENEFHGRGGFVLRVRGALFEVVGGEMHF